MFFVLVRSLLLAQISVFAQPHSDLFLELLSSLRSAFAKIDVFVTLVSNQALKKREIFPFYH